MIARSRLPNLTRRPSVLLLGLLVPIALLLYLLMGLADRLVARGVAVAFGQGSYAYTGAWFEWDGDVVARELALGPDTDAETPAAATFRRVHLDTPGWGWILRHLFDDEPDGTGLEPLRLSFDGLESADGRDPSGGTLGPIGAISASPFDTDGCMQAASWSRADLVAMGLAPGETRLLLESSSQGNRETTWWTLETEGVARTRLERISEHDRPVPPLDRAPSAGRTVSERWEVQDDGFVSARNRHCTRSDGIDLRRFIERHVETVERRLEIYGVGFDADSRIVYRRFVRDGGTLAFGGEYLPPLDATARGDWRQRLQRLQARIEHNGRGGAIAWQRIAPRPLPGLERGLPAYAVLQQEQMASLRGEVPPPGADMEAPAGGDLPVADDATAAAAPDAPPAMPPASAATPPPSEDGEASASISAPEPAAVDAPAAPAAPPPTDAAAPPTAAVTPATPATPATAPAAASPPVAEAPPAAPPPSSAPRPAGARPGTRLDWSELPQYRGRLVRIWTMHNPPRTVEILSADAQGLRVTTRLGGGRAEYTVQREGFLRATLVQ